MRLIDTGTGEFTEFADSETAPLYAILSHTWDQEHGEQSYQEVVKIQERYGLAAHKSLAGQSPGVIFGPHEIVPDAENRMQSSLTPVVEVPNQSIMGTQTALNNFKNSELHALAEEPGSRTQSTPTSEDEVPSGHSTESQRALNNVSGPMQDHPRSSWRDRICVPFLRKYSIWSLKCKGGKTRGYSSPLHTEMVAEFDHLPRTPEPAPLEPVAEPLPPAVSPPVSKTSPPTRPSIWDRDSGLSEKVRMACDIARRDGYQYIWIDSSCIDKTSSAELSGAINSMFNWYRDAQICYAFLADVPSGGDVHVEDSKFRKSRWFRRVWTLQELIAPRMVVFLSQDWNGLGTKEGLSDLVKAITNIDRDILTHQKSFANESIAGRMQWAARREATRVEDEAYSLLGIFDLTMPTLYGEGRRAFQRLQEELLQRIPDRTLFAWGKSCFPLPSEPTTINTTDVASSPFASSPDLFDSLAGKTSRISQEDFDALGLKGEEYALAPHGVRAKLSFFALEDIAPNFSIGSPIPQSRVTVDSWYLVPLGSQQFGPVGAGGQRYFVCKLCRKSRTNGGIELLRVAESIYLIDARNILGSHRAVLQTVYLPYPVRSAATRRLPWRSTSDEHQIKTLVSLSPWANDMLSSGYTLSAYSTQQLPLLQDIPLLVLRPLDNSFNIQIHFRHMQVALNTNPDPPAMVIEARIWIFPSGLSQDENVDIYVLREREQEPYTSVIWFVSFEFPPAITPRNIYLVMDSGGKLKELTLRLWLGPSVGSFRCHTYVEVMPSVRSLPPKPLSQARDALDAPFEYKNISWAHTGLKFTMMGSVVQTLKAQGYSIQLERHQNSGNFDSLSLVLFNDESGFTISIEFFATILRAPNDPSSKHQDLVVVARVTLDSESSSVLNDGSRGRHEECPYILRWTDIRVSYRGWLWCLPPKHDIALTTPTGDSLTLRVGLDLAWESQRSESEYYLMVDIQDNEGSSALSPHRVQKTPVVQLEQSFGSIYLLKHPHDHIRLTLPADTKCTLQTHGFEVDFRVEPSWEGKSDLYHLILSNSNTSIDIEYSYDLSTSSKDGKQMLTFRACVKALPLQCTQDAATQSPGQTESWDSAWRSGTLDQRGGIVVDEGWYWDLPQKDVTLILPTGTELTLRLGFCLIWLSEYCLTVKINPPKPLKGTRKPSGILSPQGNSKPKTSRERKVVHFFDDEDMEETVESENPDQDAVRSGAVSLARGSRD